MEIAPWLCSFCLYNPGHSSQGQARRYSSYSHTSCWLQRDKFYLTTTSFCLYMIMYVSQTLFKTYFYHPYSCANRLMGICSQLSPFPSTNTPPEPNLFHKDTYYINHVGHTPTFTFLFILLPLLSFLRSRLLMYVYNWIAHQWDIGMSLGRRHN